MTEIVITQQFCGPPNSGNGGYVSGLLAKPFAGVATAVLRAPPPLNTPLFLKAFGDDVRMENADGDLIGEGRPGDASDIPAPPPPPTMAQAIAAAQGVPGLHRPFHPICFSCGDKLDEGFGLRVFTGQVAGREPGFVAGPWTPNAVFADDAGLIPVEVVWAALDCAGSVAWVVTEGGGGLLGTMTCEILRRPAAEEACMVVAWPIEQQGRRRISGTALFTAEGELLARSHQVWIGRPPVAQAA
jgi:hypothetical protein